MKTPHFLLLASLAFVSGCDDRESRFPSANDFCEKEQRHISDFDKKVIVLTKWYQESAPKEQVWLTDKRTGVVKTFTDRGALPQHILAYLDKQAGLNAPKAVISDAVASYLQSNPLCCQIVKPDHLGDNVYNEDAWMADRYDNALKWGYVGDLYLFAEPDFHQIDKHITKADVARIDPAKARQIGFAIMLSNCAQTQSFFRG